ncbi:MAG: transposase [Acidimicrobiales bacterium]|nr:transposase [Acidimicrobiales bacterium]
MVDIARPRVLDLFEGRHAPQLDQWPTDQSADRKAAIEVIVRDLHEPFRRALRKHVPDGTSTPSPLIPTSPPPGWKGSSSTAPTRNRRSSVRWGGTLRRWRDQILNWHITGASNGPHRSTEPAHQEDQASRPLLSQLEQLPPPCPALHRRLQLELPGPLTPPEREEPHLGPVTPDWSIPALTDLYLNCGVPSPCRQCPNIQSGLSVNAASLAVCRRAWSAGCRPRCSGCPRWVIRRVGSGCSRRW